MKKRKKVDKKTKFCPRCGSRLHIEDAYCPVCGYSFVERAKKRKKTNWKQVIIILIILVLIYIGIRLATHHPILPKFLAEFFKGFAEEWKNKSINNTG